MVAKITIDISGGTLVSDRKSLRKALRQAGQEVANFARAAIRGGGGKGKDHKVSEPGQPPANLSGTLARSIKVRLLRGDGVRIVDTAPYALSLEVGAVGSGSDSRTRVHRKRTWEERVAASDTKRRLLPRPFLSTALDQQENSISDRIRQAVLDGIEFKKVKPTRMG